MVAHGSRNIKEEVLNNFFPCINIDLSDQLRFDSWPYPKSLMTLAWCKDDTDIVTDDVNFL